MKRAEQLKSIKMPKQKMAEDEAALDLELLGSEEDMPEGGDSEEMSSEEPMEGSSVLSEVSDEELLAELKSRGLIEGGEEMKEPSEEKEEMSEDEMA